jgi:hypothetical protein
VRREASRSGERVRTNAENVAEPAGIDPLERRIDSILSRRGLTE